MYIFSILFSQHFQGFLRGELVLQSKVSLVIDHLFIRVTFKYDSGVILLGEITCWSLLGVKWVDIHYKLVLAGRKTKL